MDDGLVDWTGRYAVDDLVGGQDSRYEEIPEGYRAAVRRGNISVHLQPVVNLHDGSVSFFEALARLTLPNGRLVHPDEFLPHLGADDQGVLFASVLDKALEILAKWDREGAHVDISVNLPPEILEGNAIPALVVEKLNAHHLKPGRLSLELLESEILNLDAQRTVLQNLVKLGVGLAMDDLGSGHSSLQRLSSLPFNAIKLDRALFLDVHNRPMETLSVLASLVQMGRDLEMNVVIEGLEDDALTEAAIVLGAPFGQGYYFARPMIVEDCTRWLSSFRHHLHRSPIQTFLGALAYHWQFARLSLCHPLNLQQCPLTRFIGATEANHEVRAWHALQHHAQGMHPASSRHLINWLTDAIIRPDLHQQDISHPRLHETDAVLVTNESTLSASSAHERLEVSRP